jgi:Cysteine-rich secretory protein family
MKKIAHHIHALFVPSHRNNYRARALHIDAMAVYVVVAVLIFSLTTPRVKSVLGIAIDITVDQLCSLTNAQRSAHGVSPLSCSGLLGAAASLKAQDMFSKNYWAHFAPDGTSPWDFFRKVGYSYEVAGENLAKDFPNSQSAMDGWMNSPAHKLNILRPDYTEVGFAVVNGNLQGSDTTLVVQFFGRPSGGGARTTRGGSLGSRAIAAEKPTPMPTFTITPTPPVVIGSATDKSGTITLGDSSTTTNPYSWLAGVSEYVASPSMNFLIVLFLGFTLIIDMYVAYRNDLLRLTGKNMAHLMVLAVAVVSYWLFASGTIL